MLIATFRQLRGLAVDTLGADELAQSEALALSKFSSKAWTGDVA